MIDHIIEFSSPNIDIFKRCATDFTGTASNFEWDWQIIRSSMHSPQAIASARFIPTLSNLGIYGELVKRIENHATVIKTPQFQP